jgi:hypothetical protein
MTPSLSAATTVDACDDLWFALSVLRTSQPTEVLLRALADLGFASRDVARCVGVTPAELRTCHLPELPAADHDQLACLLATCDVLRTICGIPDPAAWFETPIVAGCPITALTLYAAGSHRLLRRLASGDLDPQGTLSAFDPRWRGLSDLRFEAFRASDGQRSIRPQRLPAPTPN